MLQAGVGYRDVARRLGCHHTTITRLRQREADTGSANDRQRSGRPRTTDDAQDHHIRLQHLRDRFRTAVQTARGVTTTESVPLLYTVAFMHQTYGHTDRTGATLMRSMRNAGGGHIRY